MPLLYPALVAGYRGQAALNAAQARRALSRGRILVTDRLHAAVLGALSGMPVPVGDNSSEKISAIYPDYPHRFENVTMVSSFEDASEKLNSLSLD